MNVRDLHLDALHYVLQEMTQGEPRAILERTPKLAPWLPDLEQARDQTRATNAPTPPEPTADDRPDAAERARRDKDAESAVRAYCATIEGMIDLSRAQRDAAEVARLERAQTALFPDGLRFLKAARPVQVGATDRLLTRARDPLLANAVQARFQLAEHNHDAMLALIAQTNDALRVAVSAQERAQDPAPASPSPYEVRRDAQSLLRSLQAIAAEVLSPEDEALLLAALNARLNA